MLHRLAWVKGIANRLTNKINNVSSTATDRKAAMPSRGA